MKYTVSYFYYTTIISMCWLTILQAETTEAVLSNSMKCTKEELMIFFPQQIVQSALSHAKVSPEQIKEIANELSQKDRELAKIVEKKAEKLDSNPFNNLNQKDLAIKIYRETLYEVFAKVLKEHGISDDDQIQTLLEEIQAAKSRLFVECIRKQQVKVTSSPPSPSSS